MPTEKTTTATISLSDCYELLSVGEETEIEVLLGQFEALYRASSQEDPDLIPTLVETKNTILRHIVSSQMEERRYFEIISPFENTCRGCRGTGELYRFKRKTVMVNCHVCAGNKKVKVKCPSCNGTGRYIKKWKTGGGINVTCNTCKGNKEIYIKCTECRSNGKVRKIVKDSEIESTTPCKFCNGLGFIDTKIKKPTKLNTVISEDLGKAIKKGIDQVHVENNVVNE